MFTGLVEDVGTLVRIQPQGSGRELAIRTRLPIPEIAVGDSIAVDGACLTAERFEADTFIAVAGAETLAHTTLGDARIGRSVHLERALRLGDRLGGHLVQGHVDGTGRVTSARQERESWVMWVELDPALIRFVAPKGSITLDGVSLTVNQVDGASLRVNIVPHTARVTRLGGLRAGDRLNVEVDVLAKYVERLLAGRAPGLTLEDLARHGF